MPSLTRILHLLLLVLLCVAPGTAMALDVLVVLSEPSPIYQEFAEAVRTELRDNPVKIDVLTVDVDHLGARQPADAQFVIGVGNRAAELLAARDIKVPTLLALLPRSVYEHITANRKEDRLLSAVFIDQPPARYIDLVRVALPNIDRPGFLSGSDSRDAVARLTQAARERRMRPIQERIDNPNEYFPALQRVLSECGVLMAVPDTTVFNSTTIPNILLSAFRYRVPVVGFSDAYVRTGALIALYSTPTQLGTQAAEIARTVAVGGILPEPQYPRAFSVGINWHVARSLALHLDSETSIHDRLERMERP